MRISGGAGERPAGTSLGRAPAPVAPAARASAASASSRSNDSARWEPRLSSMTAWISSTITARVVRSKALPLSLVSRMDHRRAVLRGSVTGAHQGADVGEIPETQGVQLVADARDR